MTRDQVIERIRKLARMTEANGASEAEAMFAAQRLAELMAEHNVVQSELELRRDARGCVTDSMSVSQTLPSEWTSLAVPIAKLFNIKVWRTRELDDDLGLGLPSIVVKFFGFPEDVLASTTLMTICLQAINVEVHRFAAPLKGTARQVNQQMSDFRVGMINRLYARIEELINRKPTGRGLIVLKDQLVAEEFGRQYPTLNLSKARSGKARKATDAYYAGHAAGDRVDLGGSARVSAPNLRLK